MAVAFSPGMCAFRTCRISLEYALAFIIVITIACCIAGCSSNRIAVTPPTGMVRVPAGNNAFYSIESVTVAFRGLPPGKWKDGGFSGQFTRAAEERYPELFRREPSTIPLAVRIEAAMSPHDGVALLAFIGTLGIMGGLLPSLPWVNECQLAVRAEDARGAPLLSSQMQVDHHGWWSLFSPCGLMTVPGESDAPKISTIGRGGPGNVPREYQDYMVQCMVDALAAELVKRGGVAPSAYAPGPAVPSSQPGLPTALPPPVDSPGPF